MDRLMKLRWPGDIPVRYYHSEFAPITKEQAIAQIYHFCDWLNHATSVPIYYAGELSKRPEIGDPGFSVSFVDQSVIDAHATQENIWAMCHRLGDDFEMKSVVCRFGHEGISTVAKFAGILPHEIKHGLGIEHWDDDLSMMNANPYQHYSKQALVRVQDLLPFLSLARKMPAAHPSAYDFGNIDHGQVLIHIPLIFALGGYHSVTLRGFQDKGSWFLEAKREDFRRELLYVSPVATLDHGDLLTIPLRYMGANFKIRASLVKTGYSMSRFLFEVIEIERLEAAENDET